MTDVSVRIGKDALGAFAREIFVAVGVVPAIAGKMAEVLVWANLRGHDSHGVLRIPRYVELIRKKAINPAPNMRVERSKGAIVVLEADRAPGAASMSRAMDEAIGAARQVGIGWCGARNTTHAGAIGYFALQATDAGMAGIVMTASRPMMAYHGSGVPALATNPIAIAVPTGGRPFVLDMSTSMAANGKLLEARDRNEAVPLGWGVDAEGNSTTDPKKIETLLPLGGPKGSGLSFMIECLASLAIGNPRIAPALNGEGPGGDSPFFNGVAIAVDIALLGGLTQFTREADRLGATIGALPPAQGVDRIFLPGERGYAMSADRKARGIPVAEGTWTRLTKIAAELGVKPPIGQTKPG